MKLSEHIKKKEFFDENTLIDWFMQTCLALLYIHSKNILHRDIRPSNIFLMKQNYVKLGYFGVAKSLTPGLKYTKTRVSMPQYSAPEILNNQEYTNKADIWSLGVTFYQLITLNYPFEGTTEEEKEKNIKDGKKIEKPKECPIDQQFIEIIDKMLSIKDDERPSAEEILDKAIIKSRMQAYLIENGFDSLKTSQSITEYEEKEDKKTNINNNIFVIEDEKEDEFDKDLIDIFNGDMVNKNEEKRNKKANYALNRQMTLMSKHIKKANTFPSRSSKINI